MASQYDASNISLAGMSIHQVKCLSQDPTIQRKLEELNQYNPNDILPAHLVSSMEAIINQSETPLPPPSSSSSTKRKYAGKRNPDIEFATEIGQGLLVEVRKLQNTIQEKDEVIEHLENARLENERHHETSQRYMRQREEVEERLKEENWNLEVANQELRTHVSESNQTMAKYNSEQVRLTKQVKTQSEQIDIMKAQEEKNASIIEAMKARHEQETHHLRKHAANAQRENAQVQKQVEAINTELKICKAKLAIKMATTAASSSPTVRLEEPMTPVETEFTDTENFKEPSSTPRSQNMETETLKQSLAHAHRIISNLRTSAHKEKLEKFELKKMLSDSQEQVEQLSKDLANAALSRGPKPINKKKPTKKRRGGVARQARGVSNNVSSDSDRLKSDSEESVDSIDEDLMDPQFGGLGLGFGTPINAPLSSELEFKVQVSDAAINTELDLQEFVQKQVKDELELISSRAAMLLLPQQMNILVQHHVFEPKSMHHTMEESNVEQVRLEQPSEEMISKSDVEQCIRKALEKKMNILQPEMIVWITEELKHSKDMMTKSVADAYVSRALDKQTSLIQSENMFTKTDVDRLIAEAVQKISPAHTDTIPKSQVDQLIAKALEKQNASAKDKRKIQAPKKSESEDITIPKSQVDLLIAEALEEQNMLAQDTVARSEVDKLISEALEKQQLDLPTQDTIAKSEVDKLITEALEKQRREALVQYTTANSEVDRLIAQALEKQKADTPAKDRSVADTSAKDTIAKSQVDLLIADALKRQKNTFISETSTQDTVAKSQVDTLITEALEKQKTGMISRLEVDQLITDALEKQKIENKFEDTVPRSQVDTLIADALEKQKLENASEDTIPKSQVDLLIAEALEKQKSNTSSEDTIPKSQVDLLIAEALEKQKTTLTQNTKQEVFENQKSDTPAEDTIPKSQVDQLITEALKNQEDTVHKSQVDLLIAEALKKQKREDTITRSEVDQSIKQSLKNSPAEETIPKSQVDQLIAEALSKQEKHTIVENATEDMIAKSEVDQLINDTLEKASLNNIQTENMVAQSQVDLLIADALKKNEQPPKPPSVEAHIQEKTSWPNAETVQNISNNTAAKEENITTVDSRELMIAKSEVDKLIAEATEKGIILGEQRVQVTENSQPEIVERQVVQEPQVLSNKAPHIEEKDMVPKSKAELMVAEAVALEKEHVALTMVSKAEAEKMATKALEEAKLEMKKMEQSMVTKSKAETMIEQAKESVRADLYAKFEKAEQEAKKDMVTKVQADTMALEAVEKVRLNMVSKEEVQEQVTKAIEKEHEKMLEHHQKTLDQALLEVEETNKTERTSLNKRIESYKKECEDMNQRMKNMLTRESTDILIKRAVADALKTAERKQKEVLANMISKVDADILMQQAISRSLEQERKEAAAREEAEAIKMISRAEAEALAKAAAADAIVKERQTQSAREKELVSKVEADLLAKRAVHEAVEKEKLRHAEILAKERRAMKEKEEKLITKEQAESISAEAVCTALEKERKSRPIYSQQIGTQSSLIPERSNSTSKLSPSSSEASPSQSAFTPSSGRTRLRLSSSVSSLRRHPSAENSIRKKDATANRPSIENTRSYGTLRILDSSTYGSRIVGSKSSLRNVSKQDSSTSISTMSSEDARQQSSVVSRAEDNFAMFSGGEGTTNMDAIFAITQTMIGGWMLKHTRRYVGGGISENKHRRFFWVHPYTKTLYWSSIEPGVDGGESKAKSAFIESVIVVASHNQYEASPMSLLIRTPRRDLKMTAPNIEKHEMWLKSLQHILGRTKQTQSSDEIPAEENQYNNTMQSIKSMIPIHDPNQYDSDDSEDLVNIRQCCDGKHDLSTLSKKHPHSHS
ncbi:unnamed protein product [Rhizopus stolonifer]